MKNPFKVIKELQLENEILKLKLEFIQLHSGKWEYSLLNNDKESLEDAINNLKKK